MEHNLRAEANPSKEAEENIPACVGEPHSFIQIDGLSYPFIHPYPIPHTTHLCMLELISDILVPTLVVEDCGLPNTKTPNEDIMRQVIKSRGLGNFIVALECRNERGELGPTSSHHEKEGVNKQVDQSGFRRQESPVSQKPYTEGSQKWRAERPSNKDRPFPARPDTHIKLHENSIEEPHEQEQPALLQVRGSASRHRTHISRTAQQGAARNEFPTTFLLEPDRPKSSKPANHLKAYW